MSPKRGSRLFRYTWRDAWQVLALSSFFGLHVALAVSARALGPVGLAAFAPLFVFGAYLATVCGHNHFHTPIFRAPILNRGLDLLISSISRGPQSGYAEVHKAHHARAISYTRFSLAQTLHVDSVATIARTIALAYVSAFRLQYLAAAFSLFVLRRPPPPPPPPDRPSETFDAYFDGLMRGALEEIARADRRAQAWLGLEVLAGALFAAALFAVSPAFMLLFYVPISLLRDTLFLYSEYCQHYGADDADPRTDAASCYGAVMNFLAFNVDHHQEHHLRPGVHWTHLPRIRERMLPDAERRVVPRALLLNPLFPLAARPPRGV